MIRDPKHTAFRALAAVALGGLMATPAAAQVPDLMPYQGYLTDDAGEPYEGEVSMTFRMYQDGDAPGAMWTEQWDAVPVEGGVFYVYLGMFSPVANALASGDARYLGVSIDGEGEATPRQRVGSVPYAMMANDARTLDGLAPDDFATQADLAGYARWDVLGERGYVTVANLDDRGYATQQWVTEYVGEQGYATVEDIEGIEVDLTGYATEQWVRDQGYLTADAIGDIEVDLTGYATEDWVRGYVGEQGYLRADALEGFAREDWVLEQDYASRDWVTGYVGEQGYLRAADVEAYGYVNDVWVQQYVGDQGFLGGDALAGYATEQWVEGHVGDQGYIRADALEGYATEQWVRDQGYLTGAALEGYATEQWVRDQGYITGADVDGRGYITGADVTARGYVTGADVDDRGYITGADVDARGYITGADVDARNYVTGAALDARNYATRGYVDTLRADVSRTYVTTAALEARGFITAAALDPYATSAALDALVARVDQLEDELDQVAAATGSFLLGRSNQTSNGRFSFNGSTGIQAANAMCRATYVNEPTAHFCSPDEVFRAVASGAYNAANAASFDNVFTWTVTQGAITSRGANSLTGNCQNLLYNSGDAANGTRIRVDIDYRSNGNGGGITGDVVQIQQEVGCGNNHPVLCCR